MARWPGAFGWVGVLGFVAACGGNVFVLGAEDGAPEAGQESGPGPDDAADEPVISSDAPVMSRGVYCGPLTTCDTPKPICCTGVTTGISCADSAAGCGCVTRLACASDNDCSAAQPVCCIRSVANPSCGTVPVFLATCGVACTVGGTRLCDPNAPTCPLNKACSTDSSKLQAVSLPEGKGFGVCEP